MAETQPARVLEVEPITPSIKRLSLDTLNQPIVFRSGQWVDLHLIWEGEPVIGGYSITSAPSRSDRFELAIKQAATHKATKAVHELLRVGDTVHFKGGQGGFTLRETEKASDREHPRPHLMVAGGIGITPILSMIRHLDETEPDAKLTLLYSARGAQELAFRDDLDAMAARRPGFEMRYFVTGTSPVASDASAGRIGRSDLEDALSSLGDEDRANVDAYICGPPPMTESISGVLGELGLAVDRIHFERWW
jgi:ferredoxin-NADP reductase